MTESIYLPQGVVDGQKIKLGQLGHCSDCFGSPSGDLLLSIQVKEHETMKREGQDVVSNLPISFLQAILGGSVEIETVDGPKVVTIEPGSQTNDELTLSKLGAWEFNPAETYDSQELRGDHKVILQVQFPKENELSEK